MRYGVVLLAAVVLSLTAPGASGGEVKILDDFESGVIKWAGDHTGSIVAEYASHGAKAYKVTFGADAQYPGVTASAIDLDWSGYDTLKIDIYNPQTKPVPLAIRIDDEESTGTYASRYNGEFTLINGQTRLAIPFTDIHASGRPLDVSKIREFRIFMSDLGEETVLYFDNIRLVKGAEGPETMGREFASGDETPELKWQRTRAETARESLRALVSLAKEARVGTLEAGIALTTADLGLDVRAELPWYAARKGELYEYVESSCTAARDALKEILEGERDAVPVPLLHDTSTLEVKGSHFFETGDLVRGEKPVIVFSMLYQRRGPLINYFTPLDYFTHTHSFAGASRYDVEETPLYKVYHAYEETHRVWNGDPGWCGHIVRDSASWGGGREPVVVCLESPYTKAAIEEYIRSGASRWKGDPHIHFNIMGGELSYICYCDYTLAMFRNRLQSKYKTIEALNDVWGTQHESFDDVTVMPNASQASENRGRWYDWQEFNCKRFVDHAEWSKSIIRTIDKDIAVGAGAVSYSIRTSFGRSGVDEEDLVARVDDIVVNEGSHSTITTDLLWSFAEGRKPLVDFEYHGDVAGILPHFLHGNAAMAMWWWPNEPDTEHPQFNATSLPHSWDIPLDDVAEALKIGLDVRRLGAEIAAFPKAPAEMAIFYSRSSMLQVPPEFLGGNDSPYTMELKNAYDATLCLDAPVRFVTSRQILAGQLDRYKLLVVPGATYVADKVAEDILDFAESGGTVVVTPNSLMFDEYARPREHLDTLGIKVTSMREPKFETGAVRRDSFLQGMVSSTTASDIPRETMVFRDGGLLPEGTELQGAGVFQLLETSGNARAIAETAAGEPAVIEISHGEGTVYYLAIPMLPDSLNAFIDAVADRAGISRDVSFTVDAKRHWRVEGRSVSPSQGTRVLYIVNHSDRSQDVEVSLGEGEYDLLDLRDPWRSLDASRLTVLPGRTRILAAKKR